MVCDLIYNPPEAPLLRAARARGCPAGNGLPLPVRQGALAFERWTDNPAPVQKMRDALAIWGGEFFLDKAGRTANMARRAGDVSATLHRGD